MNLVDLIILLLLLVALRRGLRLGFLSLVLSAGGFVLGLYLGTLLASALGGGITDAIGRLLAAITLSLLIGFIMAGAGEALAMRASEHLHKWKLGRVNNIFGAAFEAAFVLLIVWLLASTLSNVPTGSLGRQIRSSAIISGLNSKLPPAPDLLSELERVLNANGFPRAFIGNEPSRGPVPNTTPLSDEVVKTAQASVVKIAGRGCGGIVEGSGFAAGANLVATNAHVIAGVSRPHVLAPNGNTYNVVPVYFDQDLDIALLRVDGLPVPPLPVTAEVLPNGTSVAVMGYPGGGPLTISSGVILDSMTAVGRNIYDRGVVARKIYSLHAQIESGNSGGPMIDGQGRVAGVVFAKSVSEDQVGYAIRGSELVPVLEQYGASQAQVGTGQCAAG
jgi:S1-C subfamily serine protease